MIYQFHIFGYLNYKLFTDEIENGNIVISLLHGGRRGLDRVVVEFTTTYAIGAYHH
jgi:hypothetical protein